MVRVVLPRRQAAAGDSESESCGEIRGCTETTVTAGWPGCCAAAALGPASKSDRELSGKSLFTVHHDWGCRAIAAAAPSRAGRRSLGGVPSAKSPVHILHIGGLVCINCIFYIFLAYFLIFSILDSLHIGWAFCIFLHILCLLSSYWSFFFCISCISSLYFLCIFCILFCRRFACLLFAYLMNIGHIWFAYILHIVLHVCCIFSAYFLHIFCYAHYLHIVWIVLHIVLHIVFQMFWIVLHIVFSNVLNFFCIVCIILCCKFCKKIYKFFCKFFYNFFWIFCMFLACWSPSKPTTNDNNRHSAEAR